MLLFTYGKDFYNLHNAFLFLELATIPLKTSLFVMGLFLVSESDLSDTVTHVQKRDAGTINPVLYHPRVNHHLITYADMKDDFKAAGYKGSGENLNIRSIVLLLFRLSDKEKEDGDHSLSSMYNVRYNTERYEKVSSHIEMLTHPTKVASSIPLDYQDTFQDSLSASTTLGFIENLCTILANRKLQSVQDLETLSKDLHLGSLVQEGDDFHTAYSRLRSSFQEHYGLAVGVVEGSHRLNLAMRVACKGAVTNSFHLSPSDINERDRFQADFRASSFNAMFDIQIHVALKSLPTLLDCQTISKKILVNQKKGFSHSLGNVLSSCLEEYQRLIKNAIEDGKDPNIHRDIDIDWYNKNYKEMTIRKFKTDAELEALIKNVNEDITLIENPLNRRWLLVLPHLYEPILLHDKCRQQQNDYLEKKKSIQDKHTKESQIYLGCTVNTPWLGKVEVLKMNPGNKNPKAHIMVKIIYEFLRGLLFQSSGRTCLVNLIEKTTQDGKMWPQARKANAFTGNIHSLPVIQHVVYLALLKTDLLISILAQSSPPASRLRRNPLRFLLLQLFMKQCVKELLIVNENPKIDREYLKDKLGVVYKDYFGVNKDVTFIVQAMKLYGQYLEKYGNLYKVKQYDFLGKNMKISLHSTRNTRLDLKEEELVFKDIKVVETTMDLDGKHIRVPKDTVIPGSFVAFCQAIGNPKVGKFSSFFFHPNSYDIPTTDLPGEDEEANVPTDDFVNAEEKIIKRFTDMLNDQQSSASNSALTFSQYFSEVVEVINSHCGNDHQSLQYILQNMKEKLVNHVNDLPIEFDPTKLFDEDNQSDETSL